MLPQVNTSTAPPVISAAGDWEYAVLWNRSSEEIISFAEQHPQCFIIPLHNPGHTPPRLVLLTEHPAADHITVPLPVSTPQQLRSRVIKVCETRSITGDCIRWEGPRMIDRALHLQTRKWLEDYYTPERDIVLTGRYLRARLRRKDQPQSAAKSAIEYIDVINVAVLHPDHLRHGLFTAFMLLLEQQIINIYLDRLPEPWLAESLARRGYSPAIVAGHHCLLSMASDSWRP